MCQAQATKREIGVNRRDSVLLGVSNSAEEWIAGNYPLLIFPLWKLSPEGLRHKLKKIFFINF